MTRFAKGAEGAWHWASDCPAYPDAGADDVVRSAQLPIGEPRCEWCAEHEPAIDDRERRPRRVEPEEGEWWEGTQLRDGGAL